MQAASNPRALRDDPVAGRLAVGVEMREQEIGEHARWPQRNSGIAAKSKTTLVARPRVLSEERGTSVPSRPSPSAGVAKLNSRVTTADPTAPKSKMTFMLPGRSLLYRSLLCLLLGIFTSWFIAWGITTAIWAEWCSPTKLSQSCVFTENGPHLIERTQTIDSFRSIQVWNATRLDRTEPISLEARIESELWYQGIVPDHMGRWLYPSPNQIPENNEVAASILESDRASLLGHATYTRIQVTEYGWPMRCASQWTVAESVRQDPIPHWTWKLEMPPESLAADRSLGPIGLPLKPIWTGLAVNTIFFASIWALALVGQPLIRRWLRIRIGHCPSCGYDLKGAFGHRCPECGLGGAADKTLSFGGQ